MQFKNQKNEDKTGVNPVTAAVVGVVIAAGAAVVGAVAMNDKQNRDKVNDVLTDAKNQADQKIHQGKKEVRKVVDKVLG